MSLERKARAYIAAVEGGAVGDDLAGFYHPDVVQHEFPNRLVPNGAQRELADILRGADSGSLAIRARWSALYDQARRCGRASARCLSTKTA